MHHPKDSEVRRLALLCSVHNVTVPFALLSYFGGMPSGASDDRYIDYLHLTSEQQPRIFAQVAEMTPVRTEPSFARVCFA
jgi:hypothetical protein